MLNHWWQTSHIKVNKLTRFLDRKTVTIAFRLLKTDVEDVAGNDNYEKIMFR